MCGCDQQMAAGIGPGEIVGLIPPIARCASSSPLSDAFKQRVRAALAEAYVDHNAIGLGMARPIAIAGAVFELPTQSYARGVHRLMLDTNDRIARLPRQPRPAKKITGKPGTFPAWASPDDLARWRTVRDQWAQFYGRGNFGGQLDNVLAYRSNAQGWRNYFSFPYWDKDQAAQYEEQTRRAHSLGDAIVSKGAFNVGDHRNQEAAFAGDNNEGQWFAASGFDPTTAVHVVWQQRGQQIHAWARIVIPGMAPILLHAVTGLAQIEQELQAHPKIRQQLAISGEAQAGWFGSSAFKKLKRAAKSIGINKVVNTVRTLAKKALKNPVLQMALRATPYGQLALAINKGAGIAAAAMRGNVSAKNAIGFMIKQYKQGNPAAATALSFIRAGARSLKVPGAASGADQAAAFVALGDLYQPGNDASDIGNDVDALLTFAGAEAFGGVRWLLSRMALQPMAARPDDFGTRDALLTGRSVLASRFA